MNTVDAAQHLYRQLRGGGSDCTLLHSRFRGIERAERLTAVIGESDEPGHQADRRHHPGRRGRPRSGRRAAGDRGRTVVVADPAGRALQPRRPAQRRRRGLVGSAAEPVPLSAGGHRRDGARARSARRRAADRRRPDGARCPPAHGPAQRDRVRADLAGLFDTSPDPSGNDVGHRRLRARRGRPGRSRSPGRRGRRARTARPTRRSGSPPPSTAAASRSATSSRSRGTAPSGGSTGRRAGGPGSPSSCRRGPGQARCCWSTPPTAATTRRPASTRRRAAPCRTARSCLRPRNRRSASPSRRPRPRRQLRIRGRPRPWLTPREDPDADIDSEAPRRWQSLDEHSEQVRDQAAALLAALAPSIPPEAARSAVVAGYLHDLGKAHEIWQDAICALAEDEEKAEIAAGRPWAKSGGKGGALPFRRRRRLPPRARVAAAHRRPAVGSAGRITRSGSHPVPGSRAPRQAPRPGPRSRRPRGPAGRRGVSEQDPRPRAGRDDRHPRDARPARRHAHR